MENAIEIDHFPKEIVTSLISTFDKFSQEHPTTIILRAIQAENINTTFLRFLAAKTVI
jgi:hypothetical protein